MGGDGNMIAYFDDKGVYVEAEELPAPYVVAVRGDEVVYTPTAIPCRPDESYFWNGFEWHKHTVPVPTQITKLQAYTALSAARYMVEFDSFFVQNPEAKTIWDLASVVERQNPLVGDIADALGLDGTQVDELFIAASRL